jgi:hypothetical protein
MSQTSLSVTSGELGGIPAMPRAGRRKFSPVFDALKFELVFDLAIPPERMPLMWCLIAFLFTFFITRTIVRYIRAHADSDAPRKWWQPRNIGHGALHIHHVVIGVILVMVSGVTMVTLAVDGGVPEFTAAAIFFGIGAALVLDEFALVLPRGCLLVRGRPHVGGRGFRRGGRGGPAHPRPQPAVVLRCQPLA